MLCTLQIRAAAVHALNELLLYLGLYLVIWAHAWDIGSLTVNKHLPYPQILSHMRMRNLNYV